MFTLAVIEKLKPIFARNGIPEIVKSDKGTHYSFAKFDKFANVWMFTHVTSSPTYPKSNGLAQKTVQTVKITLEKTKRDGKDPYLAILEQRNTPVDNYKSPAQLSMGKRLRSRLPSTTNHLLPETPSHQETQRRLHKKQTQQKAYHDKSAIALPPFKTGELMRFHRDDECEPARIIEVSNSPRSYNIETPMELSTAATVYIYTAISQQQPAVIAEPTYNELKVAKDADNPHEAPSMSQNLPHPSGTSDGYHTRYGRLVKRPKRFDE